MVIRPEHGAAHANSHGRRRSPSPRHSPHQRHTRAEHSTVPGTPDSCCCPRKGRLLLTLLLLTSRKTRRSNSHGVAAILGDKGFQLSLWALEPTRAEHRKARQATSEWEKAARPEPSLGCLSRAMAAEQENEEGSESSGLFSSAATPGSCSSRSLQSKLFAAPQPLVPWDETH